MKRVNFFVADIFSIFLNNISEQ